MGGIVWDILRVFGITQASAEQIAEVERLLTNHLAQEWSKHVCWRCNGECMLVTQEGTSIKCFTCGGTGRL